MDDKFAIMILILMVILVAIPSGIVVVQDEQLKKFCCCNQSKSDPPLIGKIGPGCEKVNCSEVICQNDQNKISTSQDYNIDI